MTHAMTVEQCAWRCPEIKCSCGFNAVVDYSESYKKQEKNIKAIIQEHKEAVILEALGLVVTVEDISFK